MFVVGKVNRPGDFPLLRPTDVLQALSLAGGATPFASTDRIRVLHRAGSHQTSSRFRYSDIARGRNLDQNILLQSGGHGNRAVRPRLLVYLTAVSILCAAGRATAGPWSTQPAIGLIAEYASNPTLQAPPADRSQTSEAIIADLPVNYDLDWLHFLLAPHIRYSDRAGYSSVTSNYYHLDSSLQIADPLGSLTFTGAYYRDSSLLYAAEVANGIGVRRDTSSQDVNWLHALTERVQFQADLSTARTTYGQSTEFATLVDYRYSTLSPAIIYAATERDTVRLVGSTSRYDALNHSSSSESNNLQLGLDHRLSELVDGHRLQRLFKILEPV